ncbi:MAG: hypothetical protein FJZ15_06835 [Candidatus Omnitrophica bacterium]|nr:hypothetical protein [Candidatus Omnitrophota bacterium]
MKNVKSSASSYLSCQGVFIFVGIKPNTDFLKKLVSISPSGFIITNHSLMATREGIFACGDCVHKSLYQMVNACSDGAVAADSVHKYLIERK